MTGEGRTAKAARQHASALMFIKMVELDPNALDTQKTRQPALPFPPQHHRID